MPPKAKKPSQASIAAFFSPNSKAKGKNKATAEVIELSDSDDDVVALDSPFKEMAKPNVVPSVKVEVNGGTVHKDLMPSFGSPSLLLPAADLEEPVASSSKLSQSDQLDSDAALARALAEEWEREEKAPKRKAESPEPRTEKKPRLSPPEDEKPVLPPTSQPSPPAQKKTLHPMFAKPTAAVPTTPKVKSEPGDVQKSPTTPSRGFKVAASTADIEPIDLDTDALLFKPDEVDISAWPGGRVPYAVLVGVYVQVSRTRSRLTIVRVLTNFIHLVLTRSPIDLPPALYLLSNHLRPSYLPCELGIGSMILTKAIKEVSGAQRGDLKRLYEAHGDPGDVAFEAKVKMRTLVQPAPLMLADVYKRVVGLADIKGNASAKLKGDVVRKLMVQARGEEVRFLVRTLVGNLRIGAVRLTLLTALARATSLRDEPAPPLAPLAPKAKADPAREAVERRLAAAVALVRRVYVRHPNYSDLVEGILPGLAGLEERVPLSVGIPISPMLGSPTRALDDVFTALGGMPFAAETKLDGQRLQMHVRAQGPQNGDTGGRWVEKDGRKAWVRLFSRHLEDMTDKYPDICAMALDLVSEPSAVDQRPPMPSTMSPFPSEIVALLQAEAVTSLIVDAEIVAVDKDTGAHRTFQELTNRARKDVRVEDIKVVVDVAAFDLMLLNDVPLLQAPLIVRRHLLRSLLPPRRPTDPLLAKWGHIPAKDSTELGREGLQAWFDEVVEGKAEGLMVKLLDAPVAATVKEEVLDEEDDTVILDDDEDRDTKEEVIDLSKPKSRKKALPATYEPDMRSMGWLKVKKDYLEGLGDSLDLIPIGAWWGNGRKAGWWSPILLAARNPESGALEAVCKCMSGFTDAFYKSLSARFPSEGGPNSSKTPDYGYIDTGGLEPDIWFRPCEVWEIRGADITLSPVYPAAASHIGGERGLSLRFPRFMRIREDKGIDDATTAEEFANMYRRQMEPARKKVAAETNADPEEG